MREWIDKTCGQCEFFDYEIKPVPLGNCYRNPPQIVAKVTTEVKAMNLGGGYHETPVITTEIKAMYPPILSQHRACSKFVDVGQGR